MTLFHGAGKELCAQTCPISLLFMANIYRLRGLFWCIIAVIKEDGDINSV